MHRSRLGSIVIDCDDLERGVLFWSGALGLSEADRDETYVELRPYVSGLRILLQRVPEPKTAKTRVHLDIETDDIDAEVQRLVALGARKREGCVMEDPCGNEFCVIAPETDGFPERAQNWES
jgi:catechol 2,3-dioxygenase-like lactoylglutathione lyase family enzyme